MLIWLVLEVIPFALEELFGHLGDEKHTFRDHAFAALWAITVAPVAFWTVRKMARDIITDPVRAWMIRRNTGRDVR